jgi:hypothetical protein
MAFCFCAASRSCDGPDRYRQSDHVESPDCGCQRTSYHTYLDRVFNLGWVRRHWHDANEVYEEGLLIPIMKFANRGGVGQDLICMVRASVRELDQVVGNLYGLAACNAAGDRGLQTMIGKFGSTRW